ncbi:uncharacterized protein N7443_002647 [Penicillium atrosanguineum]|uniref:uncharacterized protein n=1 Tax=Penicillium atrosanguineum TaxID=1132637 RepID=UPI00239BE103|nr:uncharacterized protein N7443_002647 [Penicillium atrosanguineum]KAJ5122545.1 hypothetical protein N7526_009482 [Penicillium atrosanguineum]KAJ5310186.1 hypothetical protein N7443_002647 [Penicillium atrosanguineum]
MDHRPRFSQEAASSNEVPTMGSAASVARSASYPAPDHEASPKTTTTKGVNGQNEHYRQQLKTASIELLNDDRVGPGSKAGRSLQNVLMETEQRLREQRRSSLHNKGSN